MLNWSLPAGCCGLIFDCDGTLIDSMPLHYQAWVAVLRRHNLDFPEALFYEWAGVSVEEIVRRLAEAQERVVDAGTIAEERDHCFHSLAQSALRPVDAVVEIARRFHGQLPLAVATGSTQASAEASLRGIGILAPTPAATPVPEPASPDPAAQAEEPETAPSKENA